MPDEALPAVLQSLLAAIEARPDDVALRLHTAEQLLVHGLAARALQQCSAVLERDSGNAAALALLERATAELSGQARVPPPGTAAAPADFDWTAAEADVADRFQPAFADGTGEPAGPAAADMARPTVRLADVGGMEEVKRRLEMAFLMPMRNPELARRGFRRL